MPDRAGGTETELTETQRGKEHQHEQAYQLPLHQRQVHGQDRDGKQRRPHQVHQLEGDRQRPVPHDHGAGLEGNLDHHDRSEGKHAYDQVLTAPQD